MHIFICYIIAYSLPSTNSLDFTRDAILIYARIASALMQIENVTEQRRISRLYFILSISGSSTPEMVEIIVGGRGNNRKRREERSSTFILN